MAEAIYQNLVPNFYKDAPISVHLCDFPVANEEFIDKSLEDGMQAVLDIVVLGRSCRNSSNIKNRQPLSKVFVSGGNGIELSGDFLNIAKEELNVKTIEYTNDTSDFVTYKVKPQLKTLGPKYGAKLGKIRAFLDSCNTLEVVTVVKANGVYTTDLDGDKVEFALDDLLISSESAEGFTSASDKGVTVVMDTTITPELKKEGDEREVISKVQSLRKEAGFEVTDRINVYVSASGDALSVLTEKSSDIANGVLAVKVEIADTVNGYVKEWDVAGSKVIIGVEKI
jgi:isoleucyl-tRNA synthetase